MRNIILVTILLALTGCASVKNIPIDPAKRSDLQNKKLLVVQHETPSFVALTRGKGAFALAGVLAAIEAGDELVKQENLIDPAVLTSAKLSHAMSSKFNLSTSIHPEKVSTDELSKLSELTTHQDYLIHLKTVGWSFHYEAFGDYVFGFGIQFRLIDPNNLKTLAEGHCRYPLDTKAETATVPYEELVGNNAAYIKKQLSEGADFCSKHLISTLL